MAKFLFYAGIVIAVIAFVISLWELFGTLPYKLQNATIPLVILALAMVKGAEMLRKKNSQDDGDTQTGEAAAR